MTPTPSPTMTTMSLSEGPGNETNYTSDYTMSLPPSGLVSHFVVYCLQFFDFTVGGLMSLAGLCGNIINIIIFCRQGVLYDSNNATLLGLAIADFFCLVTVLGTFAFTYLSFEPPANLNWDPGSVMIMVFGRPHDMFSTITCWITAYLAFERCMCVAFPFKVKTMFSGKRSLCVVGGIFASALVLHSPYHITHALVWVTNPFTNSSFLVLQRTMDWKGLETSFVMCTSVGLRTVLILTIFVCTKITVGKVISSKQWRKSVSQTDAGSEKQDKVPSSKVNGESSVTTNTAPKQSNQAVKADKEMKLVRTITTICIIFLTCYTPDLIATYIRMGIPEIAFGGRYSNLFLILYGLALLLESINSSINVIVYYNMSTRYKKEFKRLFRMGGDQE